MKEMIGPLKETLAGGADAVLLTVIARSGSAPRGVGAHMLVAGGGRLCGTIGGGALEHRAEKTALEVLQARSSRMERYRLREDEVQDLGMVCGGEIDVDFQYIPARDAAMPALMEQIETMRERGEPCWLIRDITTGERGPMGLYGGRCGMSGMDAPKEVIEQLGHKSALVRSGGRDFFCDVLAPPGTVYIFGGGHVAQALVPVLSRVDFRCVVLEDRADFCREALFPGVCETRLIDNDHIADHIAIGQDDYVVILTRGHKDDLKVQAHALTTPACYIGVIGSRSKSADAFTRLREMGYAPHELGRITTPIGLAIKAQTPAEIAISIAAQMIRKRAERLEERHRQE